MKMFLAVFDGYKLSTSTLAYAQQLTRNEEAHLVGVFLDDFTYHSQAPSQLFAEYPNPEEHFEQLNADETRKRNEAVSYFQQSCEQAKVDFSIRRYSHLAITEILRESEFADLIIISEEETFSCFKETPPSHFLKELLADSSCPILVVPCDFKPIEKIVYLYDTRSSAIHAFKLFSYLFASLGNLPVEVITIQNETKSDLLSITSIEELVKDHFPNSTHMVAAGEPGKLIIDILKSAKENVLVVLGAYGRSALSRWMKSSMADKLISQVDASLFIAHNS